jgi:hypothetical protein
MERDRREPRRGVRGDRVLERAVALKRVARALLRTGGAVGGTDIGYTGSADCAGGGHCAGPGEELATVQHHSPA